VDARRGGARRRDRHAGIDIVRGERGPEPAVAQRLADHRVGGATGAPTDHRRPCDSSAENRFDLEVGDCLLQAADSGPLTGSVRR
jgi:hypothetical protein